MAIPLPPIPPDDFAVPTPSTDLEVAEAHRGSNESLRPQQGSLGEIKSTRIPIAGLARHTLGIILILVTVVLWTVSNFLASVSKAGTLFET